jgi:hypothetical protein
LETYFVANYGAPYEKKNVYVCLYCSHNQISFDIAFGELNAAETHTIDVAFPPGLRKCIDMLWLSGKLEFY